MATKKVFNRMYEPWGYRDQDKYLKRCGGGCCESNDCFVDVKYRSNKNKMYFYNEEGEEVGVVDVNEFPVPAVKDTSYDPSTEILTINFLNGTKLEINLDVLVNGVNKLVEDETNRATTVENTLLNLIEQAIDNQVVMQETINELKDGSFANVEYEWKQDEKKMSLNFYNSDNELKDSADLFETDENGDILFNAGDFE